MAASRSASSASARRACHPLNMREIKDGRLGAGSSARVGSKRTGSGAASAGAAAIALRDRGGSIGARVVSEGAAATATAGGTVSGLPRAGVASRFPRFRDVCIGFTASRLSRSGWRRSATSFAATGAGCSMAGSGSMADGIAVLAAAAAGDAGLAAAMPGAGDGFAGAIFAASPSEAGCVAAPGERSACFGSRPAPNIRPSRPVGFGGAGMSRAAAPSQRRMRVPWSPRGRPQEEQSQGRQRAEAAPRQPQLSSQPSSTCPVSQPPRQAPAVSAASPL